MPPDETNDGLSDAEMQFFATGDSAVLGLSEPADPAPVDPAPEPEPAPAPEPEAPSPLELALDSARQRAADLERQLAERAAPPKPAEDPLPDAETDPIGNMIAQMNRMRKQQETLELQLNEERQKAALRQQYEEFAGNVRAMKDEFTKEHPDFDAAYKHLRDIKLADMTDAGISKADALRRINQEELQFAASALERGKNPAEVMYGMAGRYGYKATATATATPPADGAAQKKAEEQVQRLSNGQFAAKQPGRAAPPANKELSAEGLKDASDRDLNNVVLDDKMWAQIVGGKSATDIFHK